MKVIERLHGKLTDIAKRHALLRAEVPSYIIVAPIGSQAHQRSGLPADVDAIEILRSWPEGLEADHDRAAIEQAIADGSTAVVILHDDKPDVEIVDLGVQLPRTSAVSADETMQAMAMAIIETARPALTTEISKWNSPDRPVGIITVMADQLHVQFQSIDTLGNEADVIRDNPEMLGVLVRMAAGTLTFCLETDNAR